MNSASPVPNSCTLASEESLLLEMGVTKPNNRCGKEFMRQELGGYLGQMPVYWRQEDTYSPVVAGLREGIFRLQDTLMSAEQRERHGLERKFEEAERRFTAVQLNEASYSYSFNTGYLPRVLEESGEQAPVFRYEPQLSTQHPHEGFVFAGSIGRAHDPQTRKEISLKNYVVCPAAVETKEWVASEIGGNEVVWSRLRHIDVVLAGTQDFQKCKQFATDHLKDVAQLAAVETPRLSDKVPHSDTYVFDCSRKKCKFTGNLMELSGDAKIDIIINNTVVCPISFMTKTPLSNGLYKEVGAIAVGTTDPCACKKVISAYLDRALGE